MPVTNENVDVEIECEEINLTLAILIPREKKPKSLAYSLFAPSHQDADIKKEHN